MRLWFSFGSPAVGVMSIAPSERAVRQRQLSQMLDELAVHLSDARRMWWDGKRTTCLENKWIARISPARLSVLSERRPGARRVRSAHYDGATGRTMVTFTDGTEDRIEGGEAR